MKTIDLSKTYTIQIESMQMNEQEKEDLKYELYSKLRWLYYKSENLFDYDEEDILVNSLNSSFDYQVSEIWKEFFREWISEPDGLTIIINQ